MKLTDKAISTLSIPAGKAELIAFDDDLPGFGIRLRAGGSRVWICQYKLGPRHRRITLGSTKALTSARARTIASEIHAKVRLGQDPAQAKSDGRRLAAETFGAILRSYLPDKRAAVRPGTYLSIERHLLKHCRALHSVPIAQSRPSHDRGPACGDRRQEWPGRGEPRARVTVGVFHGAMQQGLVDTNPVIGTGKRPEQRARSCAVERRAESDMASDRGHGRL